MVRNEKGFTYPLTFCIVLLTSVVLSVQLELFVSEKRLVNESETILKQEYYFFSAVKGTENMFRENSEVLKSGVFTFSDGVVHYSTIQLTDSLYKVTYILNMGELPGVTGTGYYDKEAGKMIKWNEKG